LNLDPSKDGPQDLFWSRLFDVLEPDLDDDLAKHVHLDGRGYGYLAAQRPVVPTRLPRPFAALVRASEVVHFTDAALSAPAVVDLVGDWLALVDLKDRTVASSVASQLKKLGFSGIRP